jgi:hypothetical protein
MREVLDVKHGYSENGEVHVPGAHQYRVLVWYSLGTYKFKFSFIWLIQGEGIREKCARGRKIV